MQGMLFVRGRGLVLVQRLNKATSISENNWGLLSGLQSQTRLLRTEVCGEQYLRRSSVAHANAHSHANASANANASDGIAHARRPRCRPRQRPLPADADADAGVAHAHADGVANAYLRRRQFPLFPDGSHGYAPNSSSVKLTWNPQPEALGV
jgi:hypothetical protein